MRKALRKYLFVAAICLCTALTMAPVHAKAAGKVKNPAIVRLKPGKTYTKYDITGDKKKDKIKITLGKRDESDFIKRITVSVNGKKIVKKGIGSFYYKTSLVTLKNGKVYLWVKSSSEDADDTWGCLYQYRKGKLEKKLKFDGYVKKYYYHLSTDVVKVSGNTLTVKQSNMTSPLGEAVYKYDYKYENGKFHIVSRTAAIVKASYSYRTKSSWGTLKNNKMLYTSPSTSKSTGVAVTAGTKAKATNIYMCDKFISVKIKTADGKTGWLKCSKKFDESKLHFKECFYAG